MFSHPVARALYRGGRRPIAQSCARGAFERTHVANPTCTSGRGGGRPGWLDEHLFHCRSIRPVLKKVLREPA